MVETVALFFRSGGPMMWVILSLLAVAAAVLAERLHFYLVTCRDSADELATTAVRRLGEGKAQVALDDLAGQSSPAAVILHRTVERHAHGLVAADARLAAEESAIREVPRYGRRVSYLAMLANIATLTGLLGTIFGLQQSFSSLAVVEAAEKASILAAGISQAMNTTAFGLMVAIPCMVAYTRLASMSARKTEDCDAAAVKLLGYLEAQERAGRELAIDLPEQRTAV